MKGGTPSTQCPSTTAVVLTRTSGSGPDRQPRRHAYTLAGTVPGFSYGLGNRSDPMNTTTGIDDRPTFTTTLHYLGSEVSSSTAARQQCQQHEPRDRRHRPRLDTPGSGRRPPGCLQHDGQLLLRHPPGQLLHRQRRRPYNGTLIDTAPYATWGMGTNLGERIVSQYTWQHLETLGAGPVLRLCRHLRPAARAGLLRLQRAGHSRPTRRR